MRIFFSLSGHSERTKGVSFLNLEKVYPHCKNHPKSITHCKTQASLYSEWCSAPLWSISAQLSGGDIPAAWYTFFKISSALSRLSLGSDSINSYAFFSFHWLFRMALPTSLESIIPSCSSDRVRTVAERPALRQARPVTVWPDAVQQVHDTV